MKVKVLIADETGRKMVEVEGKETNVIGLVLTPWFPYADYPWAYAVTHEYTGRRISKGPMSLATALKFADEIATLTDWSKTYFSPEECKSLKQQVRQE